MPKILQTILLLVISNCFMTFAWYGHLRNLRTKPMIVAVLVAWSVAFFEYLLQVPANRIGAGTHSVAQLKILQECISLTVFVPFALFYLKEKWNWNFLWAGLCIMGAVFFMFRR